MRRESLARSGLRYNMTTLPVLTKVLHFPVLPFSASDLFLFARGSFPSSFPSLESVVPEIER